ncbi:hypothetical protein ACN47E_002713 [Coniothyrium glycines]
MLSQRALCRLAARGPKTSPHALPQLARALKRSLLAHSASHSPAIRAISRAYTQALTARRSYATTTADATKPSATVKKAVKAQAAKKATPKKRATTNGAAKKATANKAIAQKTPTKRTPTKKPATRKKAAAKKPVTRKRAKKVLTAEEKAKAAIATLKKRALKPPVNRYTLSGLNAFIGERSAGKSSPVEVRVKLSAAAQAWHSLSPAEREHYNHLAVEKTAARRAEYKAWIESHTPEQIADANNARIALRKRHRASGTTLKSRYPANTEKLIDERQAKAAATPFVLFTQERWATGDLKSIKLTEAAKLIASEWKALDAAEKKKYRDEFEANKASVA